ncbi:MAG: hypothetical protein HC869_21250 [Rhodospirillales bacterium]|nr:hypothetical protein [Rhodospirillales bacterium]
MATLYVSPNGAGLRDGSSIENAGTLSSLNQFIESAGPGGEVLYVAGTTREFIVLNVDLEHVRDVRQRGWNGLCQTLKSFRDTQVEYPQYSRAGATASALGQLGPLVLPSPRQKAT